MRSWENTADVLKERTNTRLLSAVFSSGLWLRNEGKENHPGLSCPAHTDTQAIGYLYLTFFSYIYGNNFHHSTNTRIPLPHPLKPVEPNSGDIPSFSVGPRWQQDAFCVSNYKKQWRHCLLLTQAGSHDIIAPRQILLLRFSRPDFRMTFRPHKTCLRRVAVLEFVTFLVGAYIANIHL